MERSIANTVLDTGQLALILGAAFGVFYVWRNWQRFSDWLNPYPEFREAMEESPTGRFLLRVQDAREPIGQAGMFPYTEEFPDFWVLLRSLPMPPPSPGFQLADLYAHTAEVGPRMGAGGGKAWFTP